MEKEISRALRPFQKRLAAEAALRAVCVSGLFALPVWLALALARRCFGGAVGRPEALMLPVWALLAAALYALRYRPTQKRLAARLDALCGMDRVATAMEFSGDSGVLCRLQREDTADRLEKTDVRALPMRWPKKALAACCVLAAMIAAAPLLPETAVEFTAGETVFDVLLRVTKEHKLHLEYTQSPLYKTVYIEGIGNLYEFDCGALSGWMYSVNGSFPNYGCSLFALQDGDAVCWLYTCDQGQDVGGGA